MRKEKALMAFDSEDDSKGNVYWLNFYDGKRHYSFKDRGAAYNFIRKKPVKVWACNLEYDIGNLIADKLEKAELHFGKSRLIYARIGKAYFYDTLNHWALSVDGMGKYLGEKKLPFNPKSLTYCKKDTSITYNFVKKMLGIYRDKFDLEASSTLPSTAFKLWRRISNFRIRAIPARELELFKRAYYGGRTECFHIGKVKGDIYYADVNSMYPYCMLGEMPYPYIYERRADLAKEGITTCSVSSALQVPVLPYRSDAGRLLFPNGNFTGTWANNELRYAVSKGVEITRVMSGYVFPITCDPFTDYVHKLYDMRRACKTDLEKYSMKLFLNSVYGKFGQGNEVNIITTLDKFMDLKVKPNNFKIYNDAVVLYKEIGDYPKHTNYIFSLYVTARARILLHTFMEDIRQNCDILYIDTDSIIYKGKSKFNFTDKLGGLKLEGRYKEFTGKTSKVYKLDDFYKVKGVPAAYRQAFFLKDRADYKKPLRIREAIRRDMKPNIWVDYHKIKVLNYEKGIIAKSGRVSPLKINT